jgi:hypothetical protein
LLRLMFDLVIMADWSAASTAGPDKPAPDRCWIAHGSRWDRPEPEYFPTRLACEDRLRHLLRESTGRVLLGFDFPFGYPTDSRGHPLLPGGRGLLMQMERLVKDELDGSNNRFEVAGRLNREIAARLNVQAGPFWGVPQKHEYRDVSAKRSPLLDAAGGPIAEYRTVERILRERGKGVQSPWKLAGAGSVGSQAIMGLPAVNRLITDKSLRSRCKLWPFDTAWADGIHASRDNMVIIAEVWPSLVVKSKAPKDQIRDAYQMRELRDWVIDQGDRIRRHLERPKSLLRAQSDSCRNNEGWILGVEA